MHKPTKTKEDRERLYREFKLTHPESTGSTLDNEVDTGEGAYSMKTDNVPTPTRQQLPKIPKVGNITPAPRRAPKSFLRKNLSWIVPTAALIVLAFTGWLWSLAKTVYVDSSKIETIEETNKAINDKVEKINIELNENGKKIDHIDNRLSTLEQKDKK